ncbi:alpha-xenorhabdolysin family binary toxin subunit A [Microcoleus sp. MON1_C5]|uniref:alpha-xenorhabdolysin family binary toxin subunit A n=1 Tax=Microcoleus sp. MON1_C5 TaxID=2818828 RepID=UPI002FCEBD87
MPNELSLVPPVGLTQPADPASGQPSRFTLFSDSWLQLQGYVGAALELPLTTGDFEQKYGSLQSSKTITECVDAMRGVREASTEFGNPKTLRAALITNPNLLATKEPPKEIYTHTVWLGQRVHQTAVNLVSGYESVYDGLTGLPPKEQVENLKAYLFDETLGPIPLSKQMSDEVGVLIKKLGAFEQKMNEYNEKFQAFTANSSDLMAEVNTAIGTLGNRIKELEQSRDEAYKAWRDFTIAACTASVGCALIGGVLAPFTGGISLAVGAAAAVATGVGLGVKAAENRAKYNEYCKQIAGESEELKKKQRLRGDLGGFNNQMKLVGPAMATFLTNLQTVQGVWVQMNTDMLAINNTITDSNVGTMPFLVKAKAKLAIDSWKSIDQSAKQFTVQSLVDYRSIAFGDPMPENMPTAA